MICRDTCHLVDYAGLQVDHRSARRKIDTRLAPSPGSNSGSWRALAGSQHTELVAVGIGHHHPVDLPLADVDASRTQRGQTLHLGPLVVAVGWSDVEVQSVLSGLRHQRRPAPGDLRA